MTTIFKQKSIIEREGLVYPKRVILANLSHGAIIIDKKGNEKIFVMPEGISLKRAYASTPGVCNFISPESNADFVRSIRSFKSKLLKPKFNGDLDKKIKILLDVFKKLDNKETVAYFTNFIKERKKMNSQEIKEEEEEEDADEIKDTVMESTRYVHTFDQFYKLSTCLPGETVIDKKFLRTNTEATKSEWVSILINVEPGTLDLLTIMRPQTRAGDTFLYLSDIVNYLKDKGVEEIIIFDFSCSTFIDEEDNEIEDREIRRRRRALKSSTTKFGGKKKSSKTKHRRNKNKKTKKRHN